MPDDHVPPAVASVSVIDAPTQTVLAPTMAAGADGMVMTVKAKVAAFEPHAFDAV